MTSFRKISVQEFHHQIKDIRSQLFDQIKCLEQRTDVQVAILGEVNDFLKKKAELDLEYSKHLDKLVKSVMLKHKNEKQKRANWTLYSTCQMWQQLVDDTKEEARQRSITADVYTNHVAPSIAQRSAALQKISKKCREVGVLAQGEVVRVLHELQTAMKTYQLCFAQFNAISAQRQQAETQWNKVQGTNSSIRKQRSMQKTFDKKSEKHEAARLKCTRARNEYLLCIDAANASLHKYFADDISDLVDCSDLGMDWWLSVLLQNMIAARKCACQVEMNALANLGSFKDSLQSQSDKQRFFENNHQAFMLPKRFDFRCEEAEKIAHISVAEGSLAEEFRQRHHQIRKRLGTLKAESELSWQNMEEAERQIRDLLSACTLIQVTEFGIASNPSNDDRRPSAAGEGLELELTKAYDAYIKTFSYYLFNANLIMRLEARADGIGNALASAPADHSPSGGNAASLSSLNSSRHQQQIEFGKNGLASIAPSSAAAGADKMAADAPPPNSLEWAQRRRKKRIGSQASTELAPPPAAANPSWRRPRLFGGSLEEYTELTGEPIPLVVVSCIRVLSQFALHHQGIFRVSGSQLEINHMREAYEIGDDPLRGVQDASDANSIAGVLKLYLRELREPLFPFYLFDLLTDCAKCASTDDFVNKICPLLNKLPRPTYLLLRYLFAFLNHLSEFSDENMMDPYNLAICFGPTLLPIPEGKDQVYYQNSVNEVVKNLIVHADAIFTARVPGPRYEKYSALLEAEGTPTPAGDLSNELELYVDDEVSTTAAVGAEPHTMAPAADNWSSLQQHTQQQQQRRLSTADLPFPPPSPQFHRFPHHHHQQQHHFQQQQQQQSLSSPQPHHRLPFLANHNHHHQQFQQQHQQQPLQQPNCSSNAEKGGNNFVLGSPPSNNHSSTKGAGPNPSYMNSSAAAAPMTLMNWSLCSANSSLFSSGGAAAAEQQRQQQQQLGFPTGNSNTAAAATSYCCYSSSESGIGDAGGTSAQHHQNGGGLVRNSVAATAAVGSGLQQQQQGSRSPQQHAVVDRRRQQHGGDVSNGMMADTNSSTADLYASIHKGERIRHAMAPSIAASSATTAAAAAQKSPSPAAGASCPPAYSALYGPAPAAGAPPPRGGGGGPPCSPSSPASTSSSAAAVKKRSPTAATGPSPTRRRNSMAANDGVGGSPSSAPSIAATSVSIIQQQQQRHHHPPKDHHQQQLRQQRREQINAIDELLKASSTSKEA